MGVWSGSRCCKSSMKASQDTVGSNRQGHAQNWGGIDAFVLHVTFSLNVPSCRVVYQICRALCWNFLTFLSQNANVLSTLVVQPNEHEQICLLHGGGCIQENKLKHRAATWEPLNARYVNLRCELHPVSARQVWCHVLTCSMGTLPKRWFLRRPGRNSGRSAACEANKARQVNPLGNEEWRLLSVFFAATQQRVTPQD